jgi:uncharacterized Zn finger protein
MSNAMSSKNWWGAAWLEKMERLAESSRFKDGVRYDEKNKVQRTRLVGRTIIGQTGSDPPFTVRITFDAFSREQWDQLFSNVRDRRALASSLALGDLPLEIQAAFSKAKLRFMPERYADLHLECGCPDWLKPCSHLVAAWLRFGRDFERDPLLLFQLRGLERKELFEILRGFAAPAPEPVPEPEPEAEESEAEIIPVRLEPLPADPEAYWAERALPVPPPDSCERRLLDDDLFEKLGPATFASNWRVLEPQFHRIYDSVYELATLVLKR